MCIQEKVVTLYHFLESCNFVLYYDNDTNDAVG